MNSTVIHSYPVWLPQTQTWMYNQIDALGEHGVEAHVVCERTENLDQFHVPNIHSLEDAGSVRTTWDKALRKMRIRRYLGHLVNVGRQVRAQLVHSHFGNVGWANLGAVRRLGAKHVVTFYGMDVNMMPQQKIWRDRYERLFAEASLFLCEGSHMARCLITLGCPQSKVRVHHLGVNVSEIRFAPRAWHPGETLRILVAATFREKKGICDALEALGELQKHVPLEVTIIGEATREDRSQAERTKILVTITKHGMRERVRLLGFQPQCVLWDEAYRHHLFLSPSVTAADGDTEGGAPVAIIEMAASGMPVISTTHCDIPEVLQPARDRFLAPERDPAGLADRMRDLLENWQSLHATLQAQRHYIEKQYDTREQGSRLAGHYRATIGAGL